MKKAWLFTFAQTVRVIIEGDEPSEDDIIDASIKAQELMPEAGANAIDSSAEDIECPYNPEIDD